MKKTAILAIAAMFGAFSGFAQGERKTNEKKKTELSAEQKADKRTQKMTEVLTLDEKQAERIGDINLVHAQNMDKLHVEIKALKAKAKEERDATKMNIEKELTSEQKEIMHQKEEERKSKRVEKKKDCCRR
jgi:hypothetical protein